MFFAFYSVQVTYKGRVFSFTTEKELITLGHWACDGLVIDVATDVWAKGRHYYTVQLAIENGVKDLIRKLKVEHNIDLY